MRTCVAVLLLSVLSIVGCGGTKDSSEPMVAAAAVPVAKEAKPQEEQAESGIGDTIQKAITGTASDVSEFTGEVYDDVTGATSKATKETVSWIQGLYDSAKKTGETTTTSARDWVMDDLKKGGAWEYKVVSLGTDDSSNEAELNKLGAARWECYAVVPGENQMTFHMKRHARSVIRNLPAKELLRLVPLLGGGDDE